MSKDKKCICSFLLYHNGSVSEDILIQTIASYKKQDFMMSNTYNEIILLLDNIRVNEYAILKNIILKMKNIRLVKTDKLIGPMAFYDKVMPSIKGAYVVFTWSGAIWYKDSLYQLKRLIAIEEKPIAYGPAFYSKARGERLRQQSIRERGLHQSDEYQSDYLSNRELLCYSLIEKDKAIDLLEEEKLDRAENPFQLDLRIMKKILYMGSGLKTKGKELILDYGLSDFYQPIHDVNNQVANQSETVDMGSNDDKEHGKKMRVAILSTDKENAQVQLCLLNYFQLLRDKIDYFWIDEASVRGKDVDDCDLVFFVRCRGDNGVKMARYCFQHHIQTAYILDDNWFCAVETYPQLEEQIGKHTLAYKRFLTLLSTVDHVIVYNQLLEADVSYYNNHVTRLQPNVNLEHFGNQKTKVRHIKTIGFAGSTSKASHFKYCLEDLRSLLIQDHEIKLRFKGYVPEKLLKDHEGEKRISVSSYIFDYKEYAKEVGAWQVGIMLSPLDNTRYINSKCPNKYLEITAVGACGIYTDCELYRKYITHGVNGLLVKNQPGKWKEAIQYLIDNPNHSMEMYQHALDDVKKQYGTKRLVNDFYQMLRTWCNNDEEG